MIKPVRGQSRIRPIVHEVLSRESCGGGKRLARVDQSDIITRQASNLAEGLGDVHAHNYYPFSAIQYNDAPNGFTWALKTHDTAMRMNGNDLFWSDRSHTKFWLFGIIPVARVGDNPDHLRSAFGRLVIEMVVWSPAALLPQFGTEWETVAPDIIRATVTKGNLIQAVDITIGADGAPQAFTIQRWSDANADKEFRLQPFGGVAKDFMNAAGIRVARKVEVGNHFGTPDYFPFFQAEIIKFEFLSDETN